MKVEEKRAAVEAVLREMCKCCCLGACASGGARREMFRARYRAAVESVRANGFEVEHDPAGLPVVSVANGQNVKNK